MKRKVKKKARSKKIIPELSLDDIYPEFLSIELQLLGLAKLFMCASADEFGKLDLDPAMNGIGELLKDYAEKIARLNASISEHAVRLS